MPFDRLGAEKTGVEGTGIGLALSHALARAMGGSLGLESQPGLGSRFWVELPTAEATDVGPVETPPATRPHAPVLRPRPGVGRILYVEDNIANLSLVERLLEKYEGPELIAVMQGGMAVQMAKEHRPSSSSKPTYPTSPAKRCSPG